MFTSRKTVVLIPYGKLKSHILMSYKFNCKECVWEFCVCYIIQHGNQDSIVGIITRLWAAWPRNCGSVPGRANLFFSCPVYRLVLGSLSILFIGYQDHFLWM